MKCILLPVTENKIIHVTEDTQFVLDFESNYSKPVVLDFIFDVENVKASILGVYKVNPNCNVDFVTTTTHNVSNTSCLINIRTVLLDKSTSKYVGKIKIPKNSQNTEAFLSHKTLVVGTNTSSHSQPILEISANNVRASHDSTTTRIGDNDTYYLRSRGLSTSESFNLILDSFINKQLYEIVDVNVKSHVEKKLLTCD